MNSSIASDLCCPLSQQTPFLHFEPFNVNLFILEFIRRCCTRQITTEPPRAKKIPAFCQWIFKARKSKIYKYFRTKLSIINRTHFSNFLISIICFIFNSPYFSQITYSMYISMLYEYFFQDMLSLPYKAVTAAVFVNAAACFYYNYRSIYCCCCRKIYFHDKVVNEESSIKERLDSLFW